MQLKTSQQFYAHSFDEATGQYLMPVRVYPESDGSCPLPRNTVNFPPTEPIGPQQTWRIDDARSAWEVVDDFRGMMLWNTASGYPVPNRLGLAEQPPVGTTTQPPQLIAPGQPLANRWSTQHNAWELVPDYSRTQLWAKADGSALPMLETGVALPASAVHLTPPTGAAPVRFDDAQGAWVKREDMSTLPSVEGAPHAEGGNAR